MQCLVCNVAIPRIGELKRVFLYHMFHVYIACKISYYSIFFYYNQYFHTKLRSGGRNWHSMCKFVEVIIILISFIHVKSISFHICICNFYSMSRDFMVLTSYVTYVVKCNRYMCSNIYGSPEVIG